MAYELVIRPATEEDILDIFEITHMAFTKYAREMGRPELVSALREVPEDIKRDLDSKHVLIALMDGVPVGSVRYYELEGGIGYLTRFGVKPECQRGGVGKALVKAVEDGCREMGLRAIMLHTSARMTNLVRFYYAAGYFIHSTAMDRGYIRALFIRELKEPWNWSLESVKDL